MNKEIHRESNRIFPASGYQKNKGIQRNRASKIRRIQEK